VGFFKLSSKYPAKFLLNSKRLWRRKKEILVILAKLGCYKLKSNTMERSVFAHLDMLELRDA
jgi:hypothetical protein